jgi:hypothetical protein
MKHIKTFEQFDYNTDMIDESFLGFGKSDEEKFEDLIKDNAKRIVAWKKQGYSFNKKSLFEPAKADNFKGALGTNKEKEIIYRNQKDIKWGSAKTHTFGGGA